MTVPILNRRVRPLEHRDLPFIRSLIPRLTEFGLPLERDPNLLHSLLNEEFKKLPSEREFTLELIAEDENGVAVGFIQCEREHDPFSGVARGYIQVLAVLEEAEGQGIGRLLLERATLWAQEKRLEGLSLHVFSSNVNARTFYAKLGFQEDNIRLIKPD